MPHAERVAFMFAGVGDARNLFATLIDIAKREQKGKIEPIRYHFNLVDIQPAAIARVLLVLMLLRRLATAANASSRDKIGMALFYVYSTVVMPPTEYLSIAIEDAIRTVEGDPQDCPAGLYIVESTKFAVARTLKAWAWEDGSAAKSPFRRLYTTPKVRNISLRQLQDLPGFGKHDISLSDAIHH